VTDEAGRITHFLAVREDITERKQAEAVLRESERRLRDMLENVQMVTLMLDDQGRILFCNEYLLGLTGWQREEVLGRDYFEIFLPAEVRDGLRQVYQSLMQGGPLSHYENEIITRTGERRLISWNNTSLKNMAGQTIGVASIGEDITERKQLEAQLRQAQKMEAIGQLAGGVAHDFNNILAATMMQLGMLQHRSDLDGELRASLAELVSHAERAANLTRQLLLFSRRSVMQVQPLDLNEAVESLLRMLRRIIGEQIDLDWRGRAQLPQVSADPGMMDQVIMNLVVNARDAMPGGGRITIATEAVEVDAALTKANPDARPGSFVCLCVADNGGGMDETVLKRIFEPFFTTKEAGKGTGLGLATVYGIVKQHQGWVTVESEVGKGSTFRIYLPAAAGLVSDAAPEKTVQPVQPGHETLLLVEDDLSVRKTIRAFLRHCGYEVIEAANGVEALTLWEANQEKIALLFTDMVMPNGLSGLQLAEKLRDLKPDLKVIISSGYSADLLQENDLAGKGIMFLPKPCPYREMAEAVRRSLDKS
jgi:PAS domain S-box-containing protein